MKRWVSVIFWAMTAATAIAEAPSGAERVDPAAERWIADLGQADPARRGEGFEKLVAMGRDARPMVLRACESEDPGIAAQAQSILLRLPWERASDPEPVRKLLGEYGNPDGAFRLMVLEKLAALTPAQSGEPLIRLLQEDPSATVRWRIVGILRRGPAEEEDDPPATLLEATPVRKSLRELDPSTQSAPLLAAIGWGWWGVDRTKALALFRRSVEADVSEPAPDFGAMAFVFRALVVDAVGGKRWEEVAELYRRRHSRAESPGDGVETAGDVAELFALHAVCGPLDSFAGDVQIYARYLGTPGVMYALSHAYQNAGEPVMARALEESAFVASLYSPSARLAVGDFLLKHGWAAQAQREFEAVVSLSMGEQRVYASNARFRLGAIAIRRGDDFAAAEQLRLGMEDAARTPGAMVTRGAGDHAATGAEAEQAIWAEIHWRYLRAATGRGDSVAAKRHLEDLLKLKADNADVALDVIPLLKEQHRDEEARRFFDKAYESLSQRLKANPTSTEALNNLAWLCARSGERLDEAMGLAERAVAAEPGNAAFLDTYAEALYRAGKVDQAIAMETRALKIRPDDAFMKSQLERFKSGKP